MMGSFCSMWGQRHRYRGVAEAWLRFMGERLPVTWHCIKKSGAQLQLSGGFVLFHGVAC